MWNAISDTRFGEMTRKSINVHFGQDVPDHETLIKAYEAHNEQVIEAIPSERLLVYDVKEGWDPLCEFLGVSAPQGDFPRVNSSEEFASAFAFFETPEGKAALEGRNPS